MLCVSYIAFVSHIIVMCVSHIILMIIVMHVSHISSLVFLIQVRQEECIILEQVSELAIAKHNLGEQGKYLKKCA